MITDKARPYYAAFVDDLLKFYNERGKNLGDNELFVEVALTFGPRLLVEVCPYIDGQIGECAVGAIEVMREAVSRSVVGAMEVAKKAVDG